LIFVTIGSMFPFDRLVRLVDDLVADFPEETFFAQIGDGTYEPRNMPFVRMLPRREFMAQLRGSRVLVAHAGMGSVISAMEVGKPIALLPRRAKLGEVNTDHQVATARWLKGRQGIHVGLEDHELKAALTGALQESADHVEMSRTAPEEFIGKLKKFIWAA
jgi:UDP-N-acetylglucosamine transferase subunit ALG13